MNRNRRTDGASSAIERQLTGAPQAAAEPAGAQPGAAQAAPETDDAPEFGRMVNELAELMRSGALPEGFDLQAACQDAAFLQLTMELPLAAAVRVYAAEQRATQADARAKAELSEQMQRRAALPQAIRGTGGAGVTRDYAGMSSEEFRALEQQYRRAAQRGIRVRL